jgi:hypothetical protein
MSMRPADGIIDQQLFARRFFAVIWRKEENEATLV